MIRTASVFFFLISLLFLFSCGSSKNKPITTFEDQKEDLHQIIEDTAKAQYASSNYQSLSFGQLKIYKPDAFVRLDSIYGIKQQYIENNQLRELKQSGIEELIPAYRAEAQQDLHKVKYEIEHIFQTATEDSLQIHHTFFVFNYKDSLLNIYPFYNFKIDKQYKELYYAYQFNYHFVTDRDLYISKEEWEFLRFFKQKEIELIGEPDLPSFMNHTLNLMETAKKAATVDFRNISKHLVVEQFKTFPEDITIENFGQLMALEQNETVIGYEFEVEWTDETNNVKKSSTFVFDPYLRFVEVNTKEM